MTTTASHNMSCLYNLTMEEQCPDGKGTTWTKTTYLECSEEPDVTVIVGGIKFKEYRPSLRCWSSYFDAAFRCGMKESQKNMFEFPDQDPAEWQWLILSGGYDATGNVLDPTVAPCFAFQKQRPTSQMPLFSSLLACFLPSSLSFGSGDSAFSPSFCCLCGRSFLFGDSSGC